MIAGRILCIFLSFIIVGFQAGLGQADQPPIVSFPFSKIPVFLPLQEPQLVTATIVDPEGRPVTVLWEQTGGPGPLTFSGAVSPTISISDVPQNGIYTFKVTATDIAEQSVSATIQIEVTTPPPLEGPNNAPVIIFASSRILVTLPAPAGGNIIRATVTDPEDHPLVYMWLQTQGEHVTLEDADTVALKVKGITKPGTYQFHLEARDPYGKSTTGDVVLIANDVPTLILAQEQTYIVPYDQVGQSTDSSGNRVLSVPPTDVAINASMSDTHPLTYDWTQTKGSTATIDGKDTAAPTIRGLQPGDYEFSVVVTDTLDATATGKVKVHVRIAPGVRCSPDVAIQLPDTDSVTLTAEGINLDGSTIRSYSWDQVRGPEADLVGDTTNSLQVKDMKAGDYRFRITVTDSNGATAENYVEVLVSPGTISFGGQTQTLMSPANSATLSASTGGIDASEASFQWLRVKGPTVAKLQNADSATLQVSALQFGRYYFDFVATLKETGAELRRQSFLVVVSTAPTVTVEEDKEIQLPIDSITLTANGVTDPRTVPVTYKWIQVDNLSPVTFSGADSETVTISRLIVSGNYAFKVTVTNGDGLQASETVRVHAEGSLSSKLAFLSSGVAAGSATICLVTGAVGAPIGYSLGIFNHLQLMAALPFIRASLPYDLVSYGRELRWSLVQQKLPFSTKFAASSNETRLQSRRHLLEVIIPPASSASMLEVFEGNLVISVIAMGALLAIHAILKLVSCCALKNVYMGFPRLEFILMHFLFFGLALNSFFVVASFRTSDGSSLASIIIRIALGVILLGYSIFVYALLKRRIGFKPCVDFKERDFQSAIYKKVVEKDKDTLALLDIEAGRSDRPEDISPLIRYEWTSRNILGDRFIQSCGALFLKFKFRSSAYTFMASENFQKLIAAAILGCIITRDGRAGAFSQASVLLLLVFIKFISLVSSKPFRDGFETVILSLVSVIELIILVLVICIIAGQRPAPLATLVVYLSIAAVVLFLIDALRILLLTIVNYRKYRALARGLLPRDEKAFMEPDYARRADAISLGKTKTDPTAIIKRIRHEEMSDSVFRTSIYVPQLYRTFNVFIPEQNAVSFATRFAGCEKVLRRGYILDVDPRNGNIFFWYDPTRWAAVIHSDWCKRKVGKLLAKRKQEIMLVAKDNGKPAGSSEAPLWDDLDVSLAGSREEAFYARGNPSIPIEFPVYTMLEYAQKICAPDAQYTEGIWRGYGFELVGFEFDLPIKLSYFGSARIAATLDRACNVSKSAVPNFLRVYDFFALSNPQPVSRRVRVVAVVEPTDMDLETFLMNLDLSQHPEEYEELMKGIIAQVILAIHAAQTSTYDSRPLNFRHNDLTPSNIAVTTSENLRNRLDRLRLPAGSARINELKDKSARRFVFYQVAERYLLGPNDSRTYVPSLNVVVDLNRSPLVKVVNFATSCCRVLDHNGRLSDDLIRGHQCPQRIPGESYDLKFFAIRLYHTLERLRKNLGPVPPAIKGMLSTMAGVDVGAHPAAGSVVDRFICFPRTLLDSPFLTSLRELPATGPAPCLGNSYYYVEHPHDKVVASAPLN